MNNMIKKYLGIRVKALREKENLTQEDLADICEVSWRTISNIERGKVIPDLKVIIALSKYFHTSLEDLLHIPNQGGIKNTKRLEKETVLYQEIKSCDDKLLAYIADQVDIILKHFKN